MAERKNWAENITVSPERILEPSDVTDVIRAVRDAEREGKQVRAIGSGWSYTDVIYTNDVLIDLARLKRILGFSQGRTRFRDESPILTEALRDTVLDGERRFCHVQAGATIRELYLALDKQDAHPGDRDRSRWALLTQGGAAGQTLAGVISTATHGADTSLAPIADWVRAIHLVGPGGIEHWIEPAGARGITEPARLRSAMPHLLAENVHYDDDWFDAVLVSMGSMGIFIDLVVEVTHQFGLAQQVVRTNWGRARSMIETPEAFDTGLFSSSPPITFRYPSVAGGQAVRAIPHAFEIFLNPYRNGDDYRSPTDFDRRCIIVTKAKALRIDGAKEGAFDPVPARSEDHFHSFWKGFCDALGAAWTLIRIESGGPGTVKDEINRIMDESRTATTAYLPGYGVMDTYDYGGAKPPIMSMEIVISTADNKHVLLIERMLAEFDRLIRLGEGRKWIGAFSLRFTMPSRALLAMQNQGSVVGRDRMCHIEVFGLKEIAGHVVHDGNMEGRTDEFVLAFEEIAHAFGARLHWGQLNLLDRARVEQGYPETLHRWRKVRTLISAPGRATTFSNWFTRRCGLEACTEVLAATSWGPNRYDVFGYNARGEVLQCWWNGAWVWSNLGNRFPGGQRFVGPLTAASWGPNRIDVFGLGERGNVLQLWWDGSWHWTDLGNHFSDGKPFAGPLTACSWSEGRYDIFGLDTSGNVRQLWFEGRWHWSKLNNGFADEQRFYGPLAATSWGPNRIDVFGLGRGGKVLQLWWDGNWHWSDLGNAFPSSDRFCGPVTAASWSANRIDLFGTGKRGNVLQLWWDGNWHWSDLGNAFPGMVRRRIGPPSSYGATVGEPYQMWLRDSERDRFAGPVTVASWAPGRLDLFGYGESGNVLQCWFDQGWHWSDLGNGWGPTAG